MAVLQSRRRIHLFNAPDPFSGFVRRLNPVFWLPLTESTGIIADNAMYTAAPGAELLTNSDFSAWTGDAPDGWTETGESGSDPQVTERDSGQQHADTVSTGGSANLYSSATSSAPRVTQNGAPVFGDTHRCETVVSYSNDVSKLRMENGSSYPLPISGADTAIIDFIAASTSFNVRGFGAAPHDHTLDSISLKKIGELDGAIVGTTTLAQSGLRGPNHAYLLDGATSLMTVYNRASIQGLTEFSLWALFNPSSAGENDNGTLFSKSDEFKLRFNSSSRDLIATVHYGTTDAQVVTSTTLAADEWHSVGLRIDDTNKQIDLFIDGVEASYASEQTGMGSRVSNINNLIVGNNVAVNQTLAGLLDEVLVMDRVLTDNEFALLHGLS